MSQRIWWTAAALALSACGGGMMEPSAPLVSTRSESRGNSETPGSVYTLSNGVSSNAVLAFARHDDGSLTPAGTFPTGGTGTGSGLGSQGAIVLNASGTLLFAVNAGSNQISTFQVTGHGLDRSATVSSGGTRPISVTVERDLLYVLNAGGTGNITGFRVHRDGGLTPIPGSTRPLSSSASGAAQIGFDPHARMLVVTEKATNVITTYMVDHSGVAGAPIVNASAGKTPFGFSFDRRGVLLVSEAFGGAPNASAVSSYTLSEDGRIHVIAASVATKQTAACWVVVTGNGRFAYVTNTGSGSLSGFGVTRGRLELLDADGRTGISAAGPIDAALSDDSKFLYALTSSGINGFRVHDNTGSLAPAGAVSGLPAGAVGLAAR